jgi:hypothetical protein
MPIKGISERRRMRRIGKVRLGKKTENSSGKEYPVALDHFNFEDAPDLISMYGDNCKEIDVMIPNENVDAFFPQERKCYRTSGLFCRGDGENATRVNVGLSDGDKNSKAVPKGQPLDPEGMGHIKEQGMKVDVGDMYDLPCSGEDCHFTEKKLCKPIGRFLFLVPNAPKIGIFEISTTSYNSIVELNSAIDTIRGVAGRISMIPLKLKLVPKDAKIPKSTMKKVIHHLVMEFNGSFSDLSKYRGATQIPMDQLPTRRELEQHIPDDIIPHAGAAMDSELSGGEQPISMPVEVVETDVVPPAKTYGTDSFPVGSTFLYKKSKDIEMRGPGKDQVYIIGPDEAKSAKSNFKAGDIAEVSWEIKDGVKRVIELNRKAGF